jgi:hypothetical protein
VHNFYIEDQQSGTQWPLTLGWNGNWSRAHALLDLSAWTREATMTETQAFVQHKAFSLKDGFNGIMERSTPH